MKKALKLVVPLVLACAASLEAQNSPGSPANKVDDPSEIAKWKESCTSFDFSKVGSCAELLFTGRPLHIAVGSLAPQNGFGAGLALVGIIPPTKRWRPTWSLDAVATANGSWRAGAYFKFVHTPDFTTVVHHGKPNIKSNLTELPEHTVFGLYAQATSLNQITYFGLGPSSTPAARSFFGMTETIVGGNVVKPILARWNASIYGEVQGRFVELRPSENRRSPSIEALYTEATAPGLTSQPGTLQFGEGFRIRPVWAADVVRLNYSVSLQQFVAGSNFSFTRLAFDFGHEFALYGSTRVLNPRSGNGPNDCSFDPVTVPECPKPYVRNLEGSIGLRVLSTLSMTPGGNVVPFYFQPTLGGRDLNGNVALGSYDDYRFRAPNTLLFRQSFEHSIWSLPIGFALMADEGKVALTRGGLGESPWVHSFSTGLTLRAGGFPEVYLLFSWGGSEGTHTVASVNASLLGGASRPSLF
jgi:hypothetical protein